MPRHHRAGATRRDPVIQFPERKKGGLPVKPGNDEAEQEIKN
jgi:hypothetical protein